jgi:hypothetical protein
MSMHQSDTKFTLANKLKQDVSWSETWDKVNDGTPFNLKVREGLDYNMRTKDAELVIKNWTHNVGAI